MNETIIENMPEQQPEESAAPEDIREEAAQVSCEELPEAEMPDEDDLPGGMTREGLRHALNARHAREIYADMRLKEHFTRLSERAAALKEKYPDFDLAGEMQNPAFARLTAPGVGIDPADAYEIVHRQSLMENARRRDLERISLAIQSGSFRPSESAMTDARVNSPMRADPRNLSMEDRRDIRRRVERGERVTF